MIGIILAPMLALISIAIGLTLKCIDMFIWFCVGIYTFIMSFPKLTLFVTLWFAMGMINGGEMNPANWM